MKFLGSLLLTIILLLGSENSCSQDSRITHIEAPKRVLFVGNSFTFYNNGLHTHLRQFVQASNPLQSSGYAQKSTTISGAMLADHESGLPTLLDSFQPDVVLLQGHSLEPITVGQSEGFQTSVRKLVQTIREHHATPALLMTWAYTDQPEMTTQLAEAYGFIADELGVMVIPAGMAFQQAEAELPAVKLRIDDRKHPSLAGSYLAASVIYSALYGESPVNIEYTAGLDVSLARQLRDIAWRSVFAYYQH